MIIFQIARHYFIEQKATHHYKFYVIGLLLLFLIGTFLFMSNYKSDYVSFQKKKNQLLNQVTLEEVHVVIPPNITAFISASDDDILPDILKIKPYEVNDPGGKLELSSYLFDRFRLDWSFIIGIWCSLAAILYSSNSLSNRKTSRLIRLNWSFPISRGQYFIGKSLGQFAAVYIPLLSIATICSIMILIFMAAFGQSYNLLNIVIRVIVLLVISSIYLLIFIYLGWFISLIRQSDSSALLTSLIIWVFLVWMWPIFGLMIIKMTQPLDSYEDASREWRMATFNFYNISEPYQEIDAITSSSLSRSEKLQKLNKLEIELENQAEKEKKEGEIKAQKLRSDYSQKRIRQTRQAFQLIGLSPYGQWIDINNLIALAGYERYVKFLEVAQEYSLEFGKVTDEEKKRHLNEANYCAVGYSTNRDGFEFNSRMGRTFYHIPLTKNLVPEFVWDNSINSHLIDKIIVHLIILCFILCILILVNYIILLNIDLA